VRKLQISIEDFLDLCSLLEENTKGLTLLNERLQESLHIYMRGEGAQRARPAWRWRMHLGEERNS
jgi:hypothetical protein